MPSSTQARGPRPLLGLTMRVVILLSLAPAAYLLDRQNGGDAVFPFTLAAFAGALAAGLVAGYVWDDEGGAGSRERKLRAIAMGVVFLVIQGIGVLVGPGTSLPIAGAATVAVLALVGWIVFGASRDASAEVKGGASGGRKGGAAGGRSGGVTASRSGGTTRGRGRRGR